MSQVDVLPATSHSCERGDNPHANSHFLHVCTDRLRKRQKSDMNVYILAGFHFAAPFYLTLLLTLDCFAHRGDGSTSFCAFVASFFRRCHSDGCRRVPVALVSASLTLLLWPTHQQTNREIVWRSRHDCFVPDISTYLFRILRFGLNISIVLECRSQSFKVIFLDSCSLSLRTNSKHLYFSYECVCR